MVHAQSAGRSILVLPLEFSRCLHVMPNSSSGAAVAPRLFRADLLMTGILFEKNLDAKIIYRTGPFAGSTCRLRDAQDMVALDMAHAFIGREQFAPSGISIR
jgi:hypothetical protein